MKARPTSMGNPDEVPSSNTGKMMRLKRRLSLGSSSLKTTKGISSAEFDFNKVLPSPQKSMAPGLFARKRKQSMTSAATIPSTPLTPVPKLDPPPELSVDDIWTTDSQLLENTDGDSRDDTPLAVSTPTSSIFPRAGRDTPRRSLDALRSKCRVHDEHVEELAHASSGDAYRSRDGHASGSWQRAAALQVQPQRNTRSNGRSHGAAYSRRETMYTSPPEPTVAAPLHEGVIAAVEDDGNSASDDEAPLAEITVVQRKPSLTKTQAKRMSLRDAKDSSTQGNASNEHGNMASPIASRDEPQLNPNAEISLASAGWKATKARSHAKSDATRLGAESTATVRRQTMHSLQQAVLDATSSSSLCVGNVNKTVSLSGHASVSSMRALPTPPRTAELGDWESGRRLGERIERLKRAQIDNKPRSATIPQLSPRIIDRSSIRDRALSADTASDHFAKLAKLAAPLLREAQVDSARVVDSDNILSRAKESLAKYNHHARRAARHICESSLSITRYPTTPLIDLPQSLYSTATRDLTAKERREHVERLTTHLIHTLSHAQLCEPLSLALTTKEASVAESMVTAVRSRFPVPAALLWEVQLCESMAAMRNEDGGNSATGHTEAVGKRTAREMRIAETTRQIYRQVVRLLQACGLSRNKDEAALHFGRGSKDLVAAIEALHEVSVVCHESRSNITESNALALEVSLWGGQGALSTGLGITGVNKPKPNRLARRALMAIDGGPMQDPLEVCLQELGDFLQRDPDAGLPGLHTLLTVSEVGLVGLDLFGNVHIHEAGQRKRHALPQVRGA